jgi:choline-sulfatase
LATARRTEPPPNLLVVVSDEHDPAATGCYGHPLVRTPHLDRLAARSLVFDNAYCTSPMCVPSRLSLFSGRYAHEIGAWDNGVVPGAGAPFLTWGHALEQAGYDTVLCGRTHFQGVERRHGFGRRLVDDLPHWRSAERPPDRTPAARRGSNSHVARCGPGADRYNAYDAQTVDAALRFLEERAARAAGGGDRPWLLYCGLMRPHFPLIAPPEDYARYDPAGVPLPATWGESLDQQHPVIRHLRWSFRNDEPLPEELQRRATASYYALVTFLDAQIGRLLTFLDRSGLAGRTAVLYTSDHGELGGQHGIWQKQCFYEASVRVPLLLAPAAAAGRPAPPPGRVAENASLVDVFPTLLDLAGEPRERWPAGLPGRSLLHVAAQGGERPTRAVSSEYHAQGMLSGGFMLKRGDLKYCAYVGHRPQLFDLRRDPLERNDLAADPRNAPLLESLHGELLRVADPVAVDARARADQARRREQADRAPVSPPAEPRPSPGGGP